MIVKLPNDKYKELQQEAKEIPIDNNFLYVLTNKMAKRNEEKIKQTLLNFIYNIVIPKILEEVSKGHYFCTICTKDISDYIGEDKYHPKIMTQLVEIFNSEYPTLRVTLDQEPILFLNQHLTIYWGEFDDKSANFYKEFYEYYFLND